MCNTIANGCLEPPSPFQNNPAFQSLSNLGWMPKRETWKAQLLNSSVRNKLGVWLDVQCVTGTSSVWHLEALLLGFYFPNTFSCAFVTWERGDSCKTLQAHRLLFFLKTTSLIFIYFSLPRFSQDIPFSHFFLIKYNGALLFNLLTTEKNKLLSEQEYALWTSTSSNGGNMQQLSTLRCFGFFSITEKIWIIWGLSPMLLIMACAREKLIVTGLNLI